MKATKLAVIAFVVAGLLATGCASKQKTQQIADLQQQLETKSSTLSDLQTSLKSMESEVDRAKAEASAKAEAARKAEAAASTCTTDLKAAQAKVAEMPKGQASTSNLSSVAGAGLLPPNAKPGECYARVFVPPTYGTETVRVLNREASERVEVVPAKYEWTQERVLVKPATTKLVEVPAKYDWTEEKVLVKAAHTVWKKGRGPIERVDNGTGEIMCLVEVPATYKTVKKKVLVASATTKTIEIPAEYKTIKTQKLVEPSRERRIPIPEEFTTVTKTTQKTDGEMAWRQVLCETNMNNVTVSAIQRALKTAGHDPGPIDGIFGRRTREAVSAYQKKNGMATGGLTMATLNKLGVRI